METPETSRYFSVGVCSIFFKESKQLEYRYNISVNKYQLFEDGAPR
jgi:hypothetical protein